MFLSSHLLAEIEHVYTHVAVMSVGRLITQGSLAALHEAIVAPVNRSGGRDHGDGPTFLNQVTNNDVFAALAALVGSPLWQTIADSIRRKWLPLQISPLPMDRRNETEPGTTRAEDRGACRPAPSRR